MPDLGDSKSVSFNRTMINSKNLKTLFFLFLLIVSFAVTSRSEQTKATSNRGEFSIGLGYPYGSLRYGGETIAGELKAAFGSGIQLWAGRFYWHFLNKDTIRLFTGGELGYIKLSGTYDISGEGWEISAFAGVETFVADWFSVALDFSPMYINLHSGNEGADGIEYVINLAVYIFPFKSARKVTTHKVQQNKTKRILTQPPTKKKQDLSAFAEEKEKKPFVPTKQIDGIVLTEDIEIIR